MMKTKGRNVKRRNTLSWLGLLGLLLLPIVIGACSSSSPYKINLMPAPAVFEDGDINPLPKGLPPVSYDDFHMLYATDRKPSDDPDQRPFYLNEPGYMVRLGQARVKAGPAGTDWETVRRVSLAKNRSGDYPLEVLSVNETGALSSTYSFLTRSTPGSTAPDQRGKKFAELVNQRLDASGVKDVYVYVHGFRVVFDVPVLVASELWHFLGYRGAFITYTWPSTPNVFAYLSDLADGLLRIPERTTIYVSSADRALVWARRLFRRERLGQMWAEDLPPRTVDFLLANPSLQFIDVTEAAGSTKGNGHAYLRKSPWVSSDLLTLLAYDIGAAERGLEKEANLLVWTFPPDFIERLRKVLAEMNPDWTGAMGKDDDRTSAYD